MQDNESSLSPPKFAIGFTVRLKLAGSPPMVVSDVDDDNEYTLNWWDANRGTMASEKYVPECLILCEIPSPVV